MKNITVYVTGLPGFKPAITKNLPQKWMVDAEDLNEELVRVELPHAVAAKRFKQLIGGEQLSAYNIMLFYDLHHNPLPTARTAIASSWNLIERIIKINFERQWRRSMDVLLNRS